MPLQYDDALTPGGLFPSRSVGPEPGTIRTTAVGVEFAVSNVPFNGPFGPGASRKVSEKVTGTDARLTNGHALKRAMEAVIFTDYVPVKLSVAVNLYYKYDLLSID
ncbi:MULTISPECIES: hypothetical protein [unclassified Raoultella]|uniref:hypothetical protein n=1 Tax=unclassified Raoultella TaxID=2627600 RepID=UPI001D1302B3|nr:MULTISPECIES: hypothetical protein [unclassified Raoultella]